MCLEGAGMRPKTGMCPEMCPERARMCPGMFLRSWDVPRDVPKEPGCAQRKVGCAQGAGMCPGMCPGRAKICLRSWDVPKEPGCAQECAQGCAQGWLSDPGKAEGWEQGGSRVGAAPHGSGRMQAASQSSRASALLIPNPSRRFHLC